MNAKFRPARMAQRLGRCLNEGSGEIAVSVKVPSTRGWTERRREPLLQIAVAQRTKGTPGITGLSFPRVHIDGRVWHLDVGSSHPGAGVGPKGWAVRPLKRYASWVQNVVRQFGPYPPWALEA